MIFSRTNNNGNSKKKAKDIIRWRGHEVMRIEAFSDGVFAFAVTLLVVSLEVPKTFEDLITSLKGFLPFGICFFMFFQVWLAQNLFFRRFGLNDQRIIMLNAALLFSVLFFVYPLKFLWTALVNKNAFSNDHDVVVLMWIYGAGFAVIYFLFALMYAHAYSRREELKLSVTEAFETKTYAYRHFGTGMIGVLSISIAALGKQYIPFAGMAYGLVGLQIGIVHSKRKKVHYKKYGQSLIAANEAEQELHIEHI